MLGWELPPYNSGGLGTACYGLCKSLAKNNVDIEFIVPYKADHNIDFMTVTSAVLIGVDDIQKAALPMIAQNMFLMAAMRYGLISLISTCFMNSCSFDLANPREFDIVHAHDWLTFSLP